MMPSVERPTEMIQKYAENPVARPGWFLTVVLVSVPFTSCVKTNAELQRELAKKGREQGLGIASVVGFRIDEVNLTTTERTQRHPFSTYQLGNVRSSPDGRMLVGRYEGLFTGMTTIEKLRQMDIAKGGPNGIVIVDVDGKEIWHQGGEVDYAGIALSPRGDQIAIQGTHGLSWASTGTNKLISLDEAAGKGHFRSTQLGWSSDGTRIVYERDSEVRIYDLEARKSSALTEGLDPTWSPDGRWIAYRSPENNAMLISPERSQKKSLIVSGRKLDGGLRWSPDSAYIMYSDLESRNYLNVMPEMKAQLVIHRLRDGAEVAIIPTMPVGVGQGFQWIVRKQRSE